MLKIGVTGGIGSGKTTVCRIFESLGVPVYYADAEARRLIEQHPLLVDGYRNLFGEESFTDGKLNKSHVARMIFEDRKLIAKVNEMVHPVVRDDFIRWSEKQNAPYVIEEAAVLLEGGGHQFLDKVVLVSASERVRIARVTKRDRVTAEQVRKRMEHQWTDHERRPLADYEIVADDNQLVVPQVLNVHFQLLK
ncbi:dephospho-CoA kinase [Thermophagus sp. OGC60D27]|uniref:dephospho-CoA kinase n=1 Tax=Thermophagus sp. OGC60D27 TaxID=3458415 RepID=UPI004037801A